MIGRRRPYTITRAGNRWSFIDENGSLTGNYITKHTNGQTTYHNPNIGIRPRAVPKYPTVPSGSIQARIQGLKAELDEAGRGTTSASHVGKITVCKDKKWKLLATDGHRALFVPYEGEVLPEQKLKVNFVSFEESQSFRIEDQDFYCTVLRAEVLSMPGGGIAFEFDGSDYFTLLCDYPETEKESFSERVDAIYRKNFRHETTPERIGISGPYLRSGLGRWTSTLTFGTKPTDVSVVVASRDR